MCLAIKTYTSNVFVYITIDSGFYLHICKTDPNC